MNGFTATPLRCRKAARPAAGSASRIQPERSDLSDRLHGISAVEFVLHSFGDAVRDGRRSEHRHRHRSRSKDRRMPNIRLIARLDVKGPNLIKSIRLEGVRVIGDPGEHARAYYQQGADELLYVDAVASLYQRNSLKEIVRSTSEDVFVPMTVAGGIRSVADVEELLRAGADKVAINTAAARRPALISEVARRFGSQCMVLSIEAKSTGARPLGSLRGQRARTHRPRSACLGPARRGSGRRRGPVDFNRSRGHRERFRLRPGSPCGVFGQRPRNSQRGHGIARSSGGSRRAGEGRRCRIRRSSAL
jgi:hypothetical protein